jgi:hypothetical protein
VDFLRRWGGHPYQRYSGCAVGGDVPSVGCGTTSRCVDIHHKLHSTVEYIDATGDVMINRTVIVAGIVIMTTGVISVWGKSTQTGPSVTRVFLGGYVVILILAAVDTFIPAAAPLVTALAGVAMVSVVLASGVTSWLLSLFRQEQPANPTAPDQVGG